MVPAPLGPGPEPTSVNSSPVLDCLRSHSETFGSLTAAGDMALAATCDTFGVSPSCGNDWQ